MSTRIAGALGGPAGPFPSSSGATAGMVTSNCLIASGGHLAFPRLDGVPTKYQMAFGIQPAAKLGRTLLEAGLADCNDWRQGEKKPVEFVEKTLHRWAAAHGADEVAGEFALALALASDLDPYGNECSVPKAIEEMYLVLEPESAGEPIDFNLPKVGRQHFAARDHALLRDDHHEHAARPEPAIAVRQE